MAKEEKYEKIIELILQDVPTSEITKITGYSIGYIHNIFEELRGEFGVNSKVGIATSYIAKRIQETTESLNKLYSLMTKCKNTPCEKRRPRLHSRTKKPKKNEN